MNKICLSVWELRSEGVRVAINIEVKKGEPCKPNEENLVTKSARVELKGKSLAPKFFGRKPCKGNTTCRCHAADPFCMCERWTRAHAKCR